MKNPWEEMNLSDYENHMKSDSVMQLQALNAMMKNQLGRYPFKTVIVLGAAGGNGFEHIDAETTRRVYAADINRAWLDACAERYKNLRGILECICVDLTDQCALPHADLLIADLLIEYIGCPRFTDAVLRIRPNLASCIIQVNTGDGFVSDSPYLHAFDGLDRVHREIQKDALTAAMKQIGYHLTAEEERALPNGKKLVQLDYTF